MRLISAVGDVFSFVRCRTYQKSHPDGKIGKRLPILGRSFFLMAVFAASPAAAQPPQHIPPASPPASKNATRYVEINIPAQAIADALLAFSEQSKIQLLTSPQTLGQGQTARVEGRYTPRQALELLLKDTALAFEFISPETVVIRPRPLSGDKEDTPTSVAQPSSSPDTAHAADAREQPPQNPSSHRTPFLDEIVVTATKRETSLQKVPFSVAVLGEHRLRMSGADSLVEAGRNVAGLTIVDLGPGQNQVTIRGVSSGQVVRDEASRKETVGVYLDESLISVALFTPDLDLFDLQRLEVLRGPQGTLFGAGSLGGTLRYISRQPDLSRREHILETGYGGIEDGTAEYALRAMMNLPFLEEKAAFRAVGYYNRIGGFIDAHTPTGTVWKDVNDGEKYGGRFAVTLAPDEDFSFTPRIVYQRLETNGFPRGDIFNLFRNTYTTTRPAAGFGPLEQFIQLREGLNDDFLLVDGKLTYDFERFSLTSVTSFLDRKLRVLRDASQLTGFINAFIFGAPSLATRDAPLLDRTDLQTFSQEIRLTSAEDRPFQWLVGSYFMVQNKAYGQTLDVAGVEDAFNALQNTPANFIDTAAFSRPLTTRPDILFISDFDIHFRQYALFGEAGYDLTERLTATVGLRWYNFDEDREGIIAGLFNNGPTAPELRRRTTAESSFNPRFILSYRLRNDISVNFQAARGFRLGGINDPLITDICREDLDALGGPGLERIGGESVWNYEVGVKAALAGGRIGINAASYYIDISDLQVAVRLPCSSTIILNVPKARSVGAELEFFARPSDRLDFSLVMNYNNTKVTRGIDLVDIRPGDRLPTSPDFQFSANLSYAQPVSDAWEVYGSFTVQHVGGSISFLLDQRNEATLPVDVLLGRAADDPLRIRIPAELSAYNLGHLRVGIRSHKGWDLALYIRNLWNEHAELALDRERGGAGRAAYLRNQPRTIGVISRINF